MLFRSKTGLIEFHHRGVMTQIPTTAYPFDEPCCHFGHTAVGLGIVPKRLTSLSSPTEELRRRLPQLHGPFVFQWCELRPDAVQLSKSRNERRVVGGGLHCTRPDLAPVKTCCWMSCSLLYLYGIVSVFTMGFQQTARCPALK